MFAMVKVILCITCILSIVLEIATENANLSFRKELKKSVRELTKSSEIKTENENATKSELPEIISDSTQIVSDKTEKEAISSINSSNSEQTKEEGNTTEKNSLTSEFSTIENIDKEKISERILSLATNSSIIEKHETSDEESLKSDKGSIKSDEKSIKSDENSAINLNYTKSKKSDFPFDSNFTEIEKNRETITDDAQKSTENLQPNKERRQIYNDDVDKVKHENVFLKAYKNCKLLVGERFLRMGDQNPVKIRKCVFAELQKLESFDGEYTKFLDNSKFIKKM